MGVAPTPDGKVYITNYDAATVSVIDTVTNTVVATIPVGAGFAFGIAAVFVIRQYFVCSPAGYQPRLCRICPVGIFPVRLW